MHLLHLTDQEVGASWDDCLPTWLLKLPQSKWSKPTTIAKPLVHPTTLPIDNLFKKSCQHTGEYTQVSAWHSSCNAGVGVGAADQHDLRCLSLLCLRTTWAKAAHVCSFGSSWLELIVLHVVSCLPAVPGDDDGNWYKNLWDCSQDNFYLHFCICCNRS